MAYWPLVFFILPYILFAEVPVDVTDGIASTTSTGSYDITPSIKEKLKMVEGKVEDCCCTTDTLEKVHAQVYPLLEQLTEKAFFRYYKLNLFRKCKFWPDNGQCSSQSCALNECSMEEFHQIWCDEENLGLVNSDVDVKIFNMWEETANPWSVDLENENEKEVTYVDLSKNPERFTGYKGDQIWKAIYSENCFTGHVDDNELELDVCLEKRVFYRLLSGLHSSISTHIAYHYLSSQTNTWGKNLEEFSNRISDHPTRVKNLYFLYLFVLRSVTKLSPFLVQYPYNTKYTQESHQIKEIMKQIQNVTLSCIDTFDETSMFRSLDSESLKKQFKAKYHNISQILDCVTCEKCRLWGKLQVNGIGTALKVLFELNNPNQELNTNVNTNDDTNFERVLTLKPDVPIRRTEIIALLNLLNKLSRSIKYAHEMFDDLQTNSNRISEVPTICDWE